MNHNTHSKKILPRLALAVLAAVLAMSVQSAVKGKDPNRQAEEADADNDKQR